MSEKKSTRRELLRPLHLLGIALISGVFAAVVTLVSTGAFTSRVNSAIANGNYDGLTPVALGLVIGGGAFIVTLLIMSMLILAVDPRDYQQETLDRPVLYDEQPGDAPPGDAEPGDADGDETEGTDPAAS